MDNILSWIIWIPIIGMVAIGFVPRGQQDLIKKIAAVTTGIQLLVVVIIWITFNPVSYTHLTLPTTPYV